MRASLKWIGVVAAALVLGALLPTGCGTDDDALLAALGGGCLLNSDCNDGLVCVFKRCHQPCNTSVDCPIDSDGEHDRCMLGSKPDHYCQLADEMGCVYNSECPGEQICGRDGECRDECQTEKDCIEDQVCAQSTCALPDELDAMGELPLVDTPDGPATGQSCVYDSECAAIDPLLVCFFGVCHFECLADEDCASHVCDRAEGAPGGQCASPTVACLPGEQRHCDCVGGGPGAQICFADGSGFDTCKDVNGSCAPP